MCKEIYLDDPNIGELEKEYLSRAIDGGYISTAGPLVSAFEKALANYLDVRKTVSTQSGTAAIHIALYELEVGQGDEVILPALTFIATANPVMYVGAKPVFVDVDIDTWNIDPAQVEESITEKTKAIIPVHLYGNPCNMGEIMRIAEKHNLFVIEDATESLGAKYRGKFTGTFANLGCFSFNGNKIITTGGGGIVVGNEVRRLDHIESLADQARDEVRRDYHPEVGFNYRMTNIEAALGLAQMGKIDEFLSKKRVFNKIYEEELESIDCIHPQKEYEDAESSWWLSCAIFEKEIDIPALQKQLAVKGIPTRRIFMPVVEFPPYKVDRHSGYKNSYHIYEKGLCLPSSTLKSKEDIYQVCKILRDTLSN